MCRRKAPASEQCAPLKRESKTERGYFRRRDREPNKPHDPRNPRERFQAISEIGRRFYWKCVFPKVITNKFLKALRDCVILSPIRWRLYSFEVERRATLPSSNVNFPNAVVDDSRFKAVHVALFVGTLEVPPRHVLSNTNCWNSQNVLV